MPRSRALTLMRLLGALLVVVPLRLSAQATLAGRMPHVNGTRKMVLEVLEEILAERGDAVQLLGQGSWLRPPDPPAKPKPGALAAPTKAGYADPLLGGSSDHDLRLVMNGKGETQAEQELMQKTWLEVREKFVAGIEKKFTQNAANLEPFLRSYGIPADKAQELAKKPLQDVIQSVKASINLYPPNQIVAGIIDEPMAIVRFKQLGAVPSLGNLVPEGVWGPGKTVTVQQLENFSRARLFYRDGAVVRAGFADLVHVVEGQGYYTRAGAANMAYQWIAKATEAFDHGDVRLVAKYLDRVSAELKIAKAKGGLPAEYPVSTFEDLKAFTQRALASDPTVAGDPQLRALLKDLETQTGILYKLERTGGTADRELLQAVLTRQPGVWERVGGQLREVGAKIPDWANMSTFMDATVLGVSAYMIPRTAASETIEAAYRQAGVDFAFLGGMGPGFAAMLTNMVLEDAKSFGYGLAIQQQDWEDFLNGISAVKGFEGTTDLKGMERNIDELALKMTTREQVEAFVRLQAYNIAALNPDADIEKRTKIAEGLEKKFTPVVIGKWQKRRNELMADALELLPDVEQAVRQLSLRLDVPTENVRLNNGSGSVIITPFAPKPPLAALQAAVSAYHDASVRLGGAKRDRVFATETYKLQWMRDSVVIGTRSASNLAEVLQPLTFQLDAEGSYDLTCTLDIDLKVQALGMDPRDVATAQPLFARQFTQSVSADIVGSVPPLPSGIAQTNDFAMEFMIPGLGFTDPNIVTRKSVVLARDEFRWSGRKFSLVERWSSKPFCLYGPCNTLEDSTLVHVEGELDSAGTTLVSAKSTIHFQSKSWSSDARTAISGTQLRHIDVEIKDVPLTRVGQDYVWEGSLCCSRIAGHVVRYQDHRAQTETFKGGSNFDGTEDLVSKIGEFRVRFKLDPKIRNGTIPAPTPTKATAPVAPTAPAAGQPAAPSTGSAKPEAAPAPSASSTTPVAPAAPASPKTTVDSVAIRAKAGADSAAAKAKAAADSAVKAAADKAKALKAAADSAKKKAEDLLKGLFKRP